MARKNQTPSLEEAIKVLVDSTCSIDEAAEKIGIKANYLRRLLATNAVVTQIHEVFGRQRITQEGIDDIVRQRAEQAVARTETREAKKAAKAAKANEDGTPAGPKITLDQLRASARTHGVKITGQTKADLMAALSAKDVDFYAEAGVEHVSDEEAIVEEAVAIVDDANAADAIAAVPEESELPDFLRPEFAEEIE